MEAAAKPGVPLSHRERCLFWAGIFEKPRIEIVRTRDGGLRRIQHPMTDVDLLAARALRFYAEHGYLAEQLAAARDTKKEG